MCGIFGIIDLKSRRSVPLSVLKRAADAMVHRGPDEDGYLQRPGFGFASRRLSIVGLADGQQPVFNEDKTITAIFNGEIFDHDDWRQSLKARGHVLTTHCDTEIFPHMWEEHAEDKPFWLLTIFPTGTLITLAIRSLPLKPILQLNKVNPNNVSASSIFAVAIVIFPMVITVPCWRKREVITLFLLLRSLMTWANRHSTNYSLKTCHRL